jgi:DNA-binding NarL/FixJ family response regulator
MAIRVVVGEDSVVIREGIERMLERSEDIEVVATCADAATLRAAIAEQRPDVVLTDIRMPPTGTDEGIQVAVELRETAPEVGVVVLSQHVEPAYALALLEGGSAGRAYLLKDRLRDSTVLTRAIREVADGGSLVDPVVVDQLIAARAQREDSPLRELTERELQILATSLSSPSAPSSATSTRSSSSSGCARTRTSAAASRRHCSTWRISGSVGRTALREELRCTSASARTASERARSTT